MIPAVLTRCAGIDIGKRGLAVCLMIGAAEAEPKVEVREFSTFTADIEAMKAWLVQAWKALVRTGNPYSTFWKAAWWCAWRIRRMSKDAKDIKPIGGTRSGWLTY